MLLLILGLILGDKLALGDTELLIEGEMLGDSLADSLALTDGLILGD